MPFRSRGTFSGLWGRVVVHLAVLLTAAAGLVAPVARAFDARSVEPSVYKIYTFIPQRNNQYSISSGTGFLVSGQRHVVTNFHVAEGGERFYIAFRSGREAKLVEARRVDSKPNVDLALLEAREDLPGAPLRLGEYEPDKLANVVAIGFPGAANLNKLVSGTDAQGVPLTDLESTVTTGVVSRMTFTSLKVSESQTLSVRTVQHSSAINPGNSGGPLFDACNNVVGVNTLQGLNSQGLFFSVHADELGRYLRDLKIPYASTSRACAAGSFGTNVVPLIVGMGLVLLAAAAMLLRANRQPAWLANLASAIGLPELERAGILTGLGRKRAASASERGALCLRPLDGGPTIRIDDSARGVTIGRGPGADVLVASDTISKVHARLTYDPKSHSVRVTDLNSSNGTFVDGVHITEIDAPLGAIVRLGTVEFKVTEPTRVSPVKTSGAWMVSGFDTSGRAVQFELKPATDPSTGRDLPATWTFGRDPSRADFVIDDGSVSSFHAQIMYDPGEPLKLRDMGSMNGTRLDGESIGRSTVALRDTGQEIRFGLAALRLSRLTG